MSTRSVECKVQRSRRVTIGTPPTESSTSGFQTFTTRAFAALLLVFNLLFIAPGAVAADFGLSATVSPTSIVVSNTLSFTINVTNTSGLSLTNVLVTNAVSASASFVSASNSLTNPLIPGSNPITVTNGSIVFQIDSMSNNAAARLSLNLSPLQTGRFTNAISVAAVGRTTAGTNVFADVFAAQADLQVAITGNTNGVLVGDQFAYTLNVTNLGPNAVSGVTLTNTLPVGFTLLSVSPTNQFAGLVNGNLTFNLGTLGAGGSDRILVTAQPTNAGSFTLPVNVAAPNLLDVNQANNSGVLPLSVGSIQSGQLQTSVVSGQQFNPQTSLMEQVVRVSNTGGSAVAAVRLNVLGLASPNRLYNAAGTNNGNPFVAYAGTLNAGASIDLLLEFLVPSRLPLTGLSFAAVAVPFVNTSAAPGTGPNITKVVSLASGGLLIEFQSVPGQSYTVLYSTNAAFTSALAAVPSIVAPANRTQWIDDGPPKTISPVTNTGSRFYRVIQNP